METPWQHDAGLVLDRLTAADIEDHFIAVAANAPRQAQIGLQTMLKALTEAT